MIPTAPAGTVAPMPAPVPSSRPAAVRQEIRPGAWLDARRALWLAEFRWLVVADLHWGYAQSHRARGNLMPLWGDAELADRLDALAADYAPAAMVWLGDSVHAAEGAAAAEAYLARSAVPVTVLAGNHDRRWAGAVQRTLRAGPWFFHHGDRDEPVPTGCTEVVGHHHPAAHLEAGPGSRLKFPALADSGSRLILPAFSPWAAGTAWNERRAPGDALWVIAPHRIFPLPISLRPAEAPAP
ncbi:MAG: hypothetical protein B9S34_05375 [Opitutia bacterium Tous-C1TDCM]|nr:MAG: hypothetical protein B9S34_05375 [Opitutae bacterium Tous-C1TDCM]